MSWKSIAGNQTVSRENLQNAIDTGVFIQKSAVPATDPKKQVIKSDVQSYIYTWDLYPPFRAAAPNQLPVKQELAVQSNQIYANGQNVIYLGNNNRDWIYPLYVSSGDEWGCVASATDNRCILAGRSYTSGAYGGGAQFSNDYGETFFNLGMIMTSNDACLGAAMSSYGDHIIATRQVGSFGSQRAYIYSSHDSGNSWSPAYHDNVDYNFNGAAMSGDGRYALVLGCDGLKYYLFRSNSYGSSFTKTDLAIGTAPVAGTKTLQGGCAAMSKSGQYQLVTPPNGYLPVPYSSGIFFLSNDFGASWNTVLVSPPPPALPPNRFSGCSISASGDYMTVSTYYSTGGASATYISSDFGTTWTLVLGSASGQAVDTSGQFQYQSNRISTDYGNTWTGGFLANAISVNSTTFTTPYMYGITTSGALYKSVDQGDSFSAVTSLSGFVGNVATSGGQNNGKYVGAIIYNGSINYTFYTSNDYGVTWQTHFSSSGEDMKCCAVSDDGKYWLVVTHNSATYSSYIFLSTDSGITFQYTGYSFVGNAVDCAMSNDGKQMTVLLQGDGGYNDNVVNSSNYGVTWAFASAPPNSTSRYYNKISMTGLGRYRTMVTTDNGNTGFSIFYSSDYGDSWSENLHISGFYGTSCDMADYGQVGVVGVVSTDGLSSRIYYTINGWYNSSYTTTDIYPLPLARPLISGVNVSSDGTYWTAVASNVGYSFTSTSPGAFGYQAIPQTFTKLTK